MTPDQEKEVAKIGQRLQQILPNVFGSIKFNLAPGRKSVNINLENFVYEESKIIKPDKQERNKE